ncbi:MAG: hypothetical protein Ta2E_07160 [Mycoplasmoidaceae bacterium]|nr:MAG: hypothetical protein Ta2E_07160 [Mycoplasmoidaceae bacterium]
MIVDTKALIDDLKKRGLIINDQEELERYINNFNANTFLVSYSEFFENEKDRFKGVVASDIIKLYVFDKNMGNHIFRDILTIEKIMNTRVAIETINYFNIEDKCLLGLEENLIKNSILRNLNEVEPYVEFKTFMMRLVKYLETNKSTKALLNRETKDDIQKWKNVPLDLMCLTWSFSNTFSFFIASAKELRHRILATFNIDHQHYKGFIDFIKNLINLRNSISHNGVVYNMSVKYQSLQLNKLYISMFKDPVKDNTMRLVNIIRMISKLADNTKTYEKTVDFGKNLKISEPYKSRIASLFDL